jgi:hypothetical protein
LGAGANRAEGWQQSEHDRREKSNCRRECQDAQIDVGIEVYRRSAAGEEAGDQIGAPTCDKQTGRGPAGEKQERLCEKLPDEPTAPGANRQADREVLSPLAEAPYDRTLSAVGRRSY